MRCPKQALRFGRRCARPFSSSTRAGASLSERNYEAATLRLKEILQTSTCEDKELSDLLIQEPPQSRVLLTVLAGGVVMAGATSLCWLTHSELLGGASLTLSSLEACAIGAFAALPLVACKEILWTPKAQEVVPVLQEVRQTQLQSLAPLISGMSALQVLVILLMEAVPPLILLLPGEQGGVRAILQPWLDSGFPLSGAIVSVLGVTVAAATAAVLKGMEWNASASQKRVVEAAITQRDPVCKVTGARKSEEQMLADSAAFKAVACTWIASRNMACRLESHMAVVEVLYMSALWYLTGDLCAPVVASVAMHAVDFVRMQDLLARDGEQSHQELGW